jgi:hypothetical protein
MHALECKTRTIIIPRYGRFALARALARSCIHISQVFLKPSPGLLWVSLENNYRYCWP